MKNKKNTTTDFFSTIPIFHMIITGAIVAGAASWEFVDCKNKLKEREIKIENLKEQRSMLIAYSRYITYKPTESLSEQGKNTLKDNNIKALAESINKLLGEKSKDQKSKICATDGYEKLHFGSGDESFDLEVPNEVKRKVHNCDRDVQ